MPRALMPGPWSSCSISSCGAKYPVCGPNTATGLPLSVWAPETSSAFDMPFFPKPSGNRPPSKIPWSASEPFGAGFAAALALTVWSITSGSGVTEPRSGIARPAGSGPVVPYGNVVPLCTVVLASGSFCERNDSHTLVPSATPYFACASSNAKADVTSLAAAGAEDAGDHSRRGDHVGHLPRLRRPVEAERDVLTGVARCRPW